MYSKRKCEKEKSVEETLSDLSDKPNCFKPYLRALIQVSYYEKLKNVLAHHPMNVMSTIDGIHADSPDFTLQTLLSVCFPSITYRLQYRMRLNREIRPTSILRRLMLCQVCIQI